MFTRLSPALGLVLLAACGDATSTTSDGGSSTGTGTTSTSTSGHVPTTSTSGTPTTGASDSLSGTGPTTSGPTSTTETTETTSTATGQVTATDATTETTTTTATTDSSTDSLTDATTIDTTGSTTGMPACEGPADCPEAPQCHLATCEAGQCGDALAPANEPCATGLCDGDGTCVDCLVARDCPMGQLCLDHQCAPPTCDDGLLGGQESDIDCGGPVCPACGAGDDCDADADCDSGVCTDQQCQPAACDDGAHNADETDVDCGGPTCLACGPDDACQTGADCQSGVCIDQVCAAPGCSDQVKNGGETDIDCGGPVCPDCGPGDACQSGSDCDTGVCTGQTCQSPSCSDLVKNGAETDVDCGGPTCPECQIGDACLVDADCQSGACEAGQCVDPSPACASAPVDPATGQRCPIFMPCTAWSECGVSQGCQQWFCNNAQVCELNALSNCGSTVGGNCNAGVVFVQHDDPPVDKRFLPPDGVDFRELASLVFTVYNNTADPLRLDKLPLVLEVMGGGSAFDVAAAKIYDDNSSAEYNNPGDLLVHLTGNPFSFPANGVLGPAAGSAFSEVKAGSSNRFLVTLAFAKEKTYIAGRAYRLKLQNPAGVTFKVGFNGPDYAGTRCGVPPAGFVGAWVTAQNP